MEKKTGGMRFPDLITKNKSYCSVYGCCERAATSPSVRFHRFPRSGECFVNIVNKFGVSEKVDKLRAWNKVLRMGKNVSAHMRVCSLHFKREDYIFPDIPSQKKSLKKNAVPSCNLPVRSVNINQENDVKSKVRSERLLERNSKKESLVLQEETVSTAGSRENTNTELSLSRTEIPTLQGYNDPAKVDNAIELIEEVSNNIPTLVDIGVQVQSGDLFRSFRSLIKNDKDLSTVTGIPSFQILDTIVDIIKLLGKDDPRSKMNIEGKVIMTFMKLKQNLTYAFLSVLFQCYTPQNCKKIFYSMLDILHECLEVAIPWPSKEEISKNVPTCFQSYADVRIILDCTEIYIQKPKKLCCELITYSHYKGTNTVKVMTGVTPGGLISFISEPYGGRVSDKTIFEQSSLINLLQKKDAIMVDKGFLIDDICKDHDIKLIRPPFLKNQVQFSQSDSLLNSSIAKARVHIERSNQRLKVFKILGSRMTVALAKKSKQILSIVSAVVNLSSPIFKDDKFAKD